MSKTYEGLTEQNEKQEVTVPEQTVPATDVTETDLANLRRAAASGMRTSFLRCARLKYTKGQWTAGEDKTEIEIGTRFIALISEFRHGYERWENNKPIYVVGKMASSFEKPDRSTLGYLDESRWPSGPYGKKDPWREMVYAPLLGEDGKLLSFNSESAGGREAVYHLAYVFTEEVRRHGGCLPVVELGTRSYETKTYGEQHAPTLRIVGWAPAPGVSLSDGDAKASVDQLPAPEEKPSRSGSDMDDEIPF